MTAYGNKIALNQPNFEILPIFVGPKTRLKKQDQKKFYSTDSLGRRFSAIAKFFVRTHFPQLRFLHRPSQFSLFIDLENIISRIDENEITNARTHESHIFFSSSEHARPATRNRARPPQNRGFKSRPSAPLIAKILKSARESRARGKKS